MKLFSALKPRLNNTSAAKRWKARTITRCLLVIIFLEETALKYAGSSFSPQERSLRMLAINLSPHLRGCYWFLLLIKCGNSDFVMLFTFSIRYGPSVLKKPLAVLPMLLWNQAGLLSALIGGRPQISGPIWTLNHIGPRGLLICLV